MLRVSLVDGVTIGADLSREAPSLGGCLEIVALRAHSPSLSPRLRWNGDASSGGC